MGDDILNPRSFVLPDYSGILIPTAEVGALFMSGNKVWVCVGAADFELVTSA